MAAPAFYLPASLAPTTMIAFIIVMAIIMALSFTDTSDPGTWHPRWRSRHRRFHPGAQDGARSHLEQKVPEKHGLFSKVKDTLNVRKHLGFVSDIDSPAAQAALAEIREREEREGPTEVEPQAPLTERVKDGLTSVTDVAVEVATGTSGGVHPVTPESPEERAEEAKSSTEATLKGESLGVISESDNSSSGDKRQDDSAVPVSKDSEQPKHKSGQEEANPKTEKDHHSFSKWALHTAHKLGQTVASKDLSDDILSKKSQTK